MDKKPAFVPHHQAPSSLFPQQLDPPEPIKKKQIFIRNHMEGESVYKSVP